MCTCSPFWKPRLQSFELATGVAVVPIAPPRATRSLVTIRHSVVDNRALCSCADSLLNRFSRDRPRFTDNLDVIKFLCKDLWTILFRKQVDNLKTNHRVRMTDALTI